MSLQWCLHFTKKRHYKNCVLFTKYITKTNETTIDDAGNLDLVKPMYNLIAYSSEYSETTGILWFYWNYEADNFDTDIGDNAIN